MAPSPVTSQEQFAMSQQMDLNVYNQLLAGDNFEMAKSGIQYGKPWHMGFAVGKPVFEVSN